MSVAPSALISRFTEELRPHPTYQVLCGPTIATKVQRVAQQGEVVRDPLMVTVDGLIIDGYARWLVARERDQVSLPCIQYDFTDEEAIRAVVKHHSGSTGLNSFCRVLMALELEPLLKAAPSSNLTNLPGRDLRKDLARIAGVSTGNFTKVKQLLGTVIPEVRDSLIAGAVRIDPAWRWRILTPPAQREALLAHLYGRPLESTIDRWFTGSRKPRPRRLSQDAYAVKFIASRLGLAQNTDVAVLVIDVAGKALAITRDLYDDLQTLQGG